MLIKLYIITITFIIQTHDFHSFFSSSDTIIELSELAIFKVLDFFLSPPWILLVCWVYCFTFHDALAFWCLVLAILSITFTSYVSVTVVPGPSIPCLWGINMRFTRTFWHPIWFLFSSTFEFSHPFPPIFIFVLHFNFWFSFLHFSMAASSATILYSPLLGVLYTPFPFRVLNLVSVKWIFYLGIILLLAHNYIP